MLLYKLMVYFSFCYLNFAKEIFVKINGEKLINTVSDNFLSFEWNPSFLIDNELELSQFFCYANVLSPAYIQVTNLVIDYMAKSSRNDSNVISQNKLKKVMHLLNMHNFTPIVSVNIINQSVDIDWKQIFSFCERIGVNNFVWQLDCRNQTFNEYIKDIKKLTTAEHKSEEKSLWKEIASDILKCSELNSTLNEFKVLLPESNVLLNAVAMNRNEFELLNKLTAKEKESIKNIFEVKNISMWENFTDYEDNSENDRALMWLKNIGIAAKMGYSTIFKEMTINDLKHPSLSYFITILHKVYVDKIVLDTEVSYNSQNVSLFTHCAKRTSMVSNGIVLYAVNEDNTEVEILLDVTYKPDANIISFILHQTANSIIINGKNVTENDDVRNIVQMIKPSKKVKVTLPSKSVGFWVLPNVNINACTNASEEKLTVNVNRRQGKSLHERENHVSKESRNLVDNSYVDINNVLTNLKDLDEETLSKMFENGENINNIKNEKIASLLNTIEKANFTTHAVEVSQILYAVDELLNLQNKIIDIGNTLLYSVNTRKIADNLNSEIYTANNKSMDEYIFNSTRIKRHTHTMQMEILKNKENKTESVDKNNDKSAEHEKMLKNLNENVIDYLIGNNKHKSSNSNDNLKIEDNQTMKIPLTNNELKTIHMKIKNNFLKQEARMSEMQKEIKSKILELRNEAIIKPHKIVKREKNGQLFNEDNIAQIEQSEISSTILSNQEKINNIENKVEKIQGNTISSENENKHVPKSEKLVWEDLSNGYNKLKEDMDVFHDIGNKLSSIFTDMKSTVSNWWKNIKS